MDSTVVHQLLRAKMAAAEPDTPPLIPGDFLSREEFLRRWEAMPGLKHAALIKGVVYMPAPLGRDHGRIDTRVITWAGVYHAATPVCDVANNATWLIRDDSAPQPDVAVWLLPEFGGRAGTQGQLAAGVPEFVAETCVSSTSYDLHQKLDLYREAGVPEYLAVLVREQEIRWHVLEGAEYRLLPAGEDGVWRSRVLPGLWLHGEALISGDTARLLAVLQEGIRSPEHLAFLARLTGQRQG